MMFEAVAAQAAAYELRVRLTADVSPKVTHLAVDGSMDQILKELKIHHESVLSPEEWEHLKTARLLRNKLFHGELHLACELVAAPAGGVMHGKLSSDDPADILAEIKRLAEQGGKPVSGTDTRETGVFGWLLETYNSGAFQKMLAVFASSKDLMSKLARGVNKPKD